MHDEYGNYGKVVDSIKIGNRLRERKKSFINDLFTVLRNK